MITLSIVIVNYNVCGFLEQCLLSVRDAVKGISHEIFVVDNASTDGSEAYISTRFPQVKYIYNTENVGFPKPIIKLSPSRRDVTYCYSIPIRLWENRYSTKPAIFSTNTMMREHWA